MLLYTYIIIIYNTKLLVAWTQPLWKYLDTTEDSKHYKLGLFLTTSA